MTSSHRSLERLPSDIFDNLIDITDEEPNQAPGGDNDHQVLANSGIWLQQRLCNKLKSFPRKINGRIKYKSVKDVGEFLKIPETALVHGLDPLLTFGTIRHSVLFILCVSRHTHV